MSYGKSELEQSVANHRKVARTVIRLKHAIAADEELNRVMPVLERRLDSMLQDGRIVPLTVDEILEIAEECE